MLQINVNTPIYKNQHVVCFNIGISETTLKYNNILSIRMHVYIRKRVLFSLRKSLKFGF